MRPILGPLPTLGTASVVAGPSFGLPPTQRMHTAVLVCQLRKVYVVWFRQRTGRLALLRGLYGLFRFWRVGAVRFHSLFQSHTESNRTAPTHQNAKSRCDTLSLVIWTISNLKGVALLNRQRAHPSLMAILLCLGVAFIAIKSN